MKFFWKSQHSAGSSWLDLGTPISSYFAAAFHPVMHFHWIAVVRQVAALVLAEVCTLLS